jgi:hypothetical protein
LGQIQRILFPEDLGHGKGVIVMSKKSTPQAPPITSPRIKHLAGIGLKTPSKLTNKQTQELAGSVERHIQRKK